MSDRPPPADTKVKATLKPAELHLLLALAEAPMHGYALAQRMAEESEGQVQMLPGNLYAVIRRLERDGLVGPSPAADTVDRRRRCFALTERGRQELGDETRRLARTVELARARLLDAATGASLETGFERPRGTSIVSGAKTRIETGIEEPEVAT